MAKIAKVEKLAVLLTDGTKSDVDDAIARKYGLIDGGLTPFTRNETSKVTRTIEQKRGPKKWTTEDDEVLLSRWDTMTREALSDRLEVSQTAMAKRHKELLAKEEQAKKTTHSKKK